MEGRRGEQSRGGWEEERVNADEYGTVRPGWGRGIVQELCSVFYLRFCTTL